MSPVARSRTAGSAASVATTSTRGMTGAGLKKCSPMTRSGCDVGAAIAATDSALVFVARMTVGGVAASSAQKIARLAPRSSRAASTTRQGAAAATIVERLARRGALPVAHRPSSSAESGSRSSRVARRSRPLRMRARPRSIAAASTSWSQTGMARLEGELRDPGAHRPGPDDADRFAGHGHVRRA